MQCLDCLSLEVLPDFLGDPEMMQYDPLLQRLVVRHRGPLNREQLRNRPPGAPRVREIRDEWIECDMCRGHGGDCAYCEGKGRLQREPHRMTAMMTVAPDDWADPERRKRILRQVWAHVDDQHAGYPDEFYAARDTYREDAVKCYRQHRSPGDGSGPHACIDYRIDAKRLTDSDWKERGAKVGIQREDVYLCSFCPYQSIVTTRKRMQRGEYDA